MINIINVTTLDGQKKDIHIPSSTNLQITADGLTLFPGLIDPHVHFRTPGLEHKENWHSAAKAALAGGYTTVFDMPNTLPPTITQENLQVKKKLIDTQLREANLPLRYDLFFGADKNHLQEIALVNQDTIGIKVFMGCSTGNLVIDDDESLQAVFEIAAKHHLIVAVHAEDETRIQSQKKKYAHAHHYTDHSKIRDIETATIAVAKAIELTKRYGTRLYILHVSSSAEIALIRKAKAEGLPVYAETTPHHLFLDEHSYTQLHGKAVVNPPLRAEREHEALLNAIKEGVIDTIGSDHAPHTVAEKSLPYGACPSGMPGIETTLPLLLTASLAGKLSLDDVIRLTYTRAREIFNIPFNDDVVLVDMNHEQAVQNHLLHTKCGWSAFEGKILRGWPVYTIVDGFVFNCR